MSTEQHYGFSGPALAEIALDIEKATTAPLLRRIAELEAENAGLEASCSTLGRLVDELRAAAPSAPAQPAEPLPPPGIHAAVHYATWLRREAHLEQEPRAGALRNAARMIDVLLAECKRLHQELIDEEPEKVLWAVMAPCGEGVVFDDETRARQVLDGWDNGDEYPTIGEAFRECYAVGLTLHKVTPSEAIP